MSDRDMHDFEVTAVELSDDSKRDSVAVTLTDARGGKVRLHLNTDMAEILRAHLEKAIDRTEGP